MNQIPKKLFTLPEARGLIPELRPRLQELREIWMRLAPYRRSAQKIRRNIESGGMTMNNVGEYLPLIQAFTKKLAYFEEAGIEIKDPASGLVDFPSQRGSRVVYLCWRMDEETITHWHEVQAGFAGRQPLEDPSA